MFKDATKFISTFLIPILCAVYITVPLLRTLIIYHMIPISIIGIVDAVFQARSIVEKVIVIFGHLIFFLLMIKFKAGCSILDLSIYIATLICALSIILWLPVWKYTLSKEQMIIMYVVIYFAVMTVGRYQISI